MGITVERINKSYGGFQALRDVDLELPAGELTTLLGPSGSGKTTLLRIIAGLETADPGSGCIRFHEQDVAARRIQERRVGFVFQHYALFRHLTVFENVAFGLRVRPRSERPARSEITRRVEKLLNLVQLESMAQRFPAQLSGGQRQRVALARALAVEPRVLLLDEPFGALDARVRKELRGWLRRLHREINVTSVFVTHDQDEALEVADRVVVMNEGRVEQVGTPDEVFHHPASEFVMRFLGDVNVFHGRAGGGQVVFSSLQLDAPDHAQADERPARIMVRPHELTLAATAPSGPSLRAAITDIHSAGPMVRLRLLADSGEVMHAELTQERFRTLDRRLGDEVHVVPCALRVFTDVESTGGPTVAGPIVDGRLDRPC